MQLIVAVDHSWAIGREGRLLYQIPEDLHRFKELTWGKAIVFGRRTMDTFPGGSPLPGRRNYVLTHHPETLPPNAIGVDSLEQLDADIIVVGGALVYEALLPRCTVAYVTKIDDDGEGDAFFPNLDAHPDWQLTEQSEPKVWNGLTYRFCKYEQKR